MSSWFEKKPLIVLAPMADLTDSPFCNICRQVSGNNFVIFREMMSAEAIVRNNEKTLKMGFFEECERPIVLQIFGANPVSMRLAAKILYNLYHPDGIDINMGCPVPKITQKSNAGAALMKNFDLAADIVREVKKERLPVPISVKTRLGWETKNDILRFAPILESAGADVLTVHGRTKKQGYAGKADWSMIGSVKKLVSIPVIANGDAVDFESYQQCLNVTSSDGVMVGRAALGNPWLFADINASAIVGNKNSVSRQEINEVILRHADLHILSYGEKSLVTFRKHLAYYLRGKFYTKKSKQALLRVNNLAELNKLLADD